MSVSAADLAFIEQQLGREPRGLREVAYYNPAGEPGVIRVASVVDDKPFPTLFWLIEPKISYRIDTDEAQGLIGRLQEQVLASDALRERMAQDHLDHIALRERYISDEERELIRRAGFEGAFAKRGIGGIADFTRIRCLHTWYAAHLVVPNTIGTLVDEHWAQSDG